MLAAMAVTAVIRGRKAMRELLDGPANQYPEVMSESRRP